MPTKTKQPAAKNSVAKKSVAKKSVEKKPTAKKPAKKSGAKKSIKKVTAQKAVVEEKVLPIEKVIHRFEKRFVFVPSCSNCDHVPMRINRLVAMMSVLVVVLSGIVIAQGQSVDLSSILVALAQI